MVRAMARIKSGKCCFKKLIELYYLNNNLLQKHLLFLLSPFLDEGNLMLNSTFCKLFRKGGNIQVQSMFKQKSSFSTMKRFNPISL